MSIGSFIGFRARASQVRALNWLCREEEVDVSSLMRGLLDAFLISRVPWYEREKSGGQGLTDEKKTAD